MLYSLSELKNPRLLYTMNDLCGEGVELYRPATSLDTPCIATPSGAPWSKSGSFLSVLRPAKMAKAKTAHNTATQAMAAATMPTVAQPL
jgi:hypothetical protein